MSHRNHIPLSFSASPSFMKKSVIVSPAPKQHSSTVRGQKKIPEMLPRGLVQGKVNKEKETGGHAGRRVREREAAAGIKVCLQEKICPVRSGCEAVGMEPGHAPATARTHSHGQL